jgi:Mlc titration factor MtfA (ptsG expression regulator)
MVWSFRNWRRRRIQQHDALPETAWRDEVASLPLLRGLSGDELKRLRELVILFLREKELVAADGYGLSGDMRLKIAAQACLPILNLSLDYYA